MPVPEAVRKLIDESGNSFHARVARWFHSNGWYTTISPYYMDQSLSKAREIDLVVEKLWPIGGRGPYREGDIVLRLFVECKYIASEAVFWFAPKSLESAEELVCRHSPFRKDNLYTSKHHYLATSPDVAKLFASSNSRAQENDPFYKALNQALNGTVALRTLPPSHPELKGRRGGKLAVLNYPVVICSSFSQLYRVGFLEVSELVPIDSCFQLEVQYAFHDASGRAHNEYFLLDIVGYDQLSTFEKALAEGADAAAYLASSS